MKTADRKPFFATLERTLEIYGKPMPYKAVLEVWWSKLEAHSVESVAIAFSRHIETTRFAPVPADILALLPVSAGERIGADEAWAIAIRSRDERETVVWTEEMAEAFGSVGHLLDGDETGARMAFRAAYERICARTSAANAPVKWVISQGWDGARREEVVTEAVRAGRLSIAMARTAVPLLADDAAGPITPKAEANLAEMKRLVGRIAQAQERASADRITRAREDAEQLAVTKGELEDRVAAYRSATTTDGAESTR